MNAVPDMRGPLGLKDPKAKREPKHLARVAALPCVICLKPGPSEVHHCFSGRYSQRRASDRETIPLCSHCHRLGPDAIHANKAEWERVNGPDYEFIPVVLDMLAGELTR